MAKKKVETKLETEITTVEVPIVEEVEILDFDKVITGLSEEDVIEEEKIND